MDKDGDGNISADDLKQVMSQLGVNLGKEDVEEMIKVADEEWQWKGQHGRVPQHYAHGLTIITSIGSEIYLQ